MRLDQIIIMKHHLLLTKLEMSWHTYCCKMIDTFSLTLMLYRVRRMPTTLSREQDCETRNCDSTFKNYFSKKKMAEYDLKKPLFLCWLAPIQTICSTFSKWYSSCQRLVSLNCWPVYTELSSKDASLKYFKDDYSKIR